MADLRKICAGLPTNPLPAHRPERDPSIPHAPNRNPCLSHDEKKVTVWCNVVFNANRLLYTAGIAKCFKIFSSTTSLHLSKRIC